MVKALAVPILAAFLPLSMALAQTGPDENDWLVMMSREFCDANKWNLRVNGGRDAMQMLLRHHERLTSLSFTGPTFTRAMVQRYKGPEATLSLIGTSHDVQVRTSTFGENDGLVLQDIEPLTILKLREASALTVRVDDAPIFTFELAGAEAAMRRFRDCHFLAPQAVTMEGFDFDLE